MTKAYRLGSTLLTVQGRACRGNKPAESMKDEVRSRRVPLLDMSKAAAKDRSPSSGGRHGERCKGKTADWKKLPILHRRFFSTSFYGLISYSLHDYAHLSTSDTSGLRQRANPVAENLSASCHVISHFDLAGKLSKSDIQGRYSRSSTPRLNRFMRGLAWKLRM